MRNLDYVMNLYENRSSNGGWCNGRSGAHCSAPILCLPRVTVRRLPHRSYHLDHPLMLLHLPTSKEGLAMLAGQCLVHLLWRWRRQLLDDKKTLHLNTYIACKKHLEDVPWLSATMLDFHNKQDWLAVLAIFSLRTCNFLEQKISAGEDHRRGTYMYCAMGMLLLDAWFAEADEATNGWTPGQSIEDAACVFAFIVVWRNAVNKHPLLKLSNDCMTRETILDSITSAGTCIYRFPLYRDRYPLYKPYGPNFCQSRFSEYGFQKCRMEESTNSPSLSVSPTNLTCSLDRPPISLNLQLARTDLPLIACRSKASSLHSIILCGG